MAKPKAPIPAVISGAISSEPLKRRLRARGAKTELAIAIGVEIQNVTNWLERGIPGAMLSRVARAIGMTVEEYEREAGIDFEPEPIPSLQEIHRKANLFSIQRLDASGSMGAGQEQQEYDRVIDQIRVTGDWIRQQLPRLTLPTNLRIISAYGDSMKPTFLDGDLLIVDVGVRTVDIDGIYVLRANQRLYIKRVRQKLDGTFVVSSDNELSGTPEELTGKQKTEVLGRVLWAWNGKRL